MRLFLACLGAALCSLCHTAAASESHAAPPAALPASTAPAAAASAPLPAAPAARKGVEDPMDRLRQRLAEKLAGGKANGTAPETARVVSHAGASAKPASGGSSVPAVTASASAQHERAAAAPAEAHAVHWDYQGLGGPTNWGQLKPEYAACGNGKRQSPIDIREGIKVQLDPVQFDYHPSGFRVVDNGHTVQVDVGPGNAIDVLGKRYELLQFHFHRPSEERVEGRQFDMVAHLVHKSAEGRLAVVAVLLEQGRAHPIVQAVWNNLPLDKGEDVAARSSLDLNALLPEDRRYYTYMGSLTTPPCSEGVLWMVMRQPVPVSPEQIGVFARLYPMNARPIQQAGGRLIKQGE